MFSKQNIEEFRIPLLILLGIIVALFLQLVNNSLVPFLLILITLIGSFDLIRDSVVSLLHRKYVLDYIAIIAIVVALITGEYLVAAVIALMISSGRTLEHYGISKAKRALTLLVDRIPDTVTLWQEGGAGEKIKINKAVVGQEILVKKGEVIPLDGEIVSESGLVDESSLTGEPYEIEKIVGDTARSGTVNIGNPLIIKVTRPQSESTYNKIIEMVKQAQEEKSPFIRLADQYSTYFTVVTLIIVAFAYLTSGQIERVLAVLVVATPCPLILATPIALIGGINSAAKKKIIIKKLAAIEILSKVKTLVLDKTGTITLGLPNVRGFENTSLDMSDTEILGVVQSLERNSLHPLAKALVEFAKNKKAPVYHARNIEEKIGQGIFGEINGKTYRLTKSKSTEGMMIELQREDKVLAIFSFEDQIKPESQAIIHELKNQDYQMLVFTGDKKTAAARVAQQLGGDIEFRSEMSPQDKQQGIVELKKQNQKVAMIGDGINDAPALALADVGMVFSNEEQTAASEAASVVFLGGDFSQVKSVMNIASKTMAIALQSIFIGIGLSILAMIFASFGYIKPITGALLQELIDVGVIINALRASRD